MRYTVSMNESEFRIVSTEYDGSLCHEAERFLRQDLERDDVALINDTFLMKSTGRRVMIAFEAQEVDGGTIEPGYWYEMDWYVLRSSLDHKAHYYGRRIRIPGVIEIERSRPIRERTAGNTPMSEVLKTAEETAKKLSKLAITEIEYPLPYPPHLYSKAWNDPTIISL